MIALLSSLILAAQLATVQPTPLQQTFLEGETLDFTLTWLRITGGNARMTIGPLGDDGTKLRITSVGKSSPRFSRIFKVRDELESVIARDNLSTLRYRKKLDERGKKKDELTVVHDGVATRTTAEKTKKTDVPTPVYDPISIIYYLRTIDLTPGKHHEFQLIADGKLKLVRADVTRRETVTTEAGTFRCVVVEPQMHAINNDARDTKLEIWFSDDEKHLPVRIRSEVPFGSITASLRSISSGVGAPDPVMTAPQ